MLFAFFFFKQKTAYEMRISDWSSDVCSSDLGTPFHYLALLDAAEALGCDMGSLRACGTGGATVPESLVARAEAAGIHMFRRYGMSEHPTVTQGADGDPLYVRMTTDGRLRPGVEQIGRATV